MIRDERPRHHLTPPANWMNDPNGMAFSGGTLHAFYQYNPLAPHWDRMHWGHAATDDLVTWRHLPVAIGPADEGPDSFGCWSGCVVPGEPAATMFYTGVIEDGGARRASICSATSTDTMVTWSKDPANPLIDGPPAGIAVDAFRDPFVWRDEQGWAMLVGAGTIDGLAAVLLYRSLDLRSWTYVGPFLSLDDVARTEGADAPCWECPQLVRIGDAAILIVSIVDRAPGVRPSHVTGFVGRVEGDRFVVDHADDLGMGPDFYAPATVVTPDGRNLLFGWIPEDPPPEASERQWAGAFTLPRVVSLGADGRLSLALAAEVASLRGQATRTGDHRLEGDGPALRQRLESQHFELAVVIEAEDTTTISIELLDGEDDNPECRVEYDAAERRLSVARRGIVSVAGRSARKTAILHAATDPRLHLRLLVDGSILELEANGRTMATLRLPTTRADRLAMAFAATGGAARLGDLTIWRLGSSA